MGPIIAGAMAGGGEAAERSGQIEQKKLGEQDLLGMKIQAEKELAETHAKLARETYAANKETDIKAAPRLEEATRPGEVARRKEFAAVDSAARIKEFTDLAPLQRQEAIKTATETLKAMTTPEMLKASRAQALATHIVDPQFTLIPNADGTMTKFDARSGKSGGQIMSPDGKTPLQVKDPAQQSAAVSVINMANTNLKIAEAAYSAVAKNGLATPEEKAKAETEWQAAQAEAKRITMPAFAVLYGKGNLQPGATPNAGGEGPKDPRTMNFSYGQVNPKNGWRWVGKPGGVLDDNKNWAPPKKSTDKGGPDYDDPISGLHVKGAAPKPAPKNEVRGIISKQVPKPEEPTDEEIRRYNG